MAGDAFVVVVRLRLEVEVVMRIVVKTGAESWAHGNSFERHAIWKQRWLMVSRPRDRVKNADTDGVEHS